MRSNGDADSDIWMFPPEGLLAMISAIMRYVGSCCIRHSLIQRLWLVDVKEIGNAGKGFITAAELGGFGRGSRLWHFGRFFPGQRRV